MLLMMLHLIKQPYYFLTKPSRWAVGRFLILTIVFTYSLTSIALAGPAAPKIKVEPGVFLIATKKLYGTSFQKTVILLTQHNDRQIMGIAINRPTDVPMNQAFPKINQLKHNTDLLYLGGPVQPRSLFVLSRTKEPKEGMHHVINDVYFSSAKNAYSPPIQKITRAYTGYSGWSRRQLQNEIKRGDWLVVNTDPAIIFEKNTSTLWDRLIKKWSGNWI